MDEQAMIAQQLAISHERLRRCVADLADEEASRVQAGLLAPIVWQLGHVALVDTGFAQKAGGTCTIPPRFVDLFRAGSGGTADYPPLADVWAAFDAAHEALLGIARTVDGAVPLDGSGRYHNVGEMLIFCTYHRGYHVGKITTLRALLGKPRLFGWRRRPTRDTGSGPTDTAEVVVIGSGVVGASVAYHLAQRGCRDVLVLERRDRPGLGSTGKASGGFRAQFTTDVCVRLSLLAREKLLRFRDEVGTDPGYRPVGYVFMAKTAAQLAALRLALGVQRAAGLHQAREVGPGEISRLSPAVRMYGIIGGTCCPIDGYIVPLEIMRGYLEAARRLGARVEYGAGEVACLVDGGPVPDARRIRGVRTERGEVATRRVVIAAGPWAGLVARTAGVLLPVTPLRRQTALTHPFPALPDDTPMTINVDDKFHFRVLDGRALLLWPGDTPTDDPFDTTFEPRWLDEMLPHAYASVPCLRDARIDLDRCLCGLYEMSPDKHAIVGPAPGVEGLFLVNGSSGHGVMHAPALGHLVAEMILDSRAHTLDVRALRPTRFDEGEPNIDTGVL